MITNYDSAMQDIIVGLNSKSPAKIMQTLFHLATNPDYQDAAIQYSIHYDILDSLADEQSKLQLNCAYIDLFEEKVYDTQVWNESFNPWCRARFNLHTPDLAYNDDGTRAGTRADMFHERKKV